MEVLQVLSLLGAFGFAAASSSAPSTHTSTLNSCLTTLIAPSPSMYTGIHNHAKRSRAGIAMDAAIPASDCWAKEACVSLFSDMKHCYDLVGHFGDPDDVVQDKSYQGCFCSRSDNSIPSPPCYRCMISAQISPDSVSLWRDAVHNFCSTSAPSIYLFLIDMISFANLASAPRPWAALGPDIYAVTTASSRFTPATELNRPGPLKWSATASPPTKSAIKTETAEIPQSVLDQLPPNWPYTTLGVARQPGVWTTYNLTNAQGQLTAQVVASLQWYPKPIGHQRVVFVPWLDPRLVTNSAMRSVTASTTATAAMPTPSATTTAKSGGRSTDIGKPPTISQTPVRGTPPLTTSIDAVSGTPTPTGTSIGVGSWSLGEVHSSQTRAASGSSITTSTSGDWNGHRK